MNKSNALAGLIGSYGDSDDDSDDGAKCQGTSNPPIPGYEAVTSSGTGIHPAPIQHCPWSACYDESSGFTYYWNQQTNAVTWEAPPEYLLALKLAQQQLHIAGSTEVSAEEWQMYQQALAEKQNSKVLSKPPVKAVVKKPDKGGTGRNVAGKKRTKSVDDEEKIELITSYHNSDSESNDEGETPTKIPKQPPLPPQPPQTPKTSKQPPKKVKKTVVEYGPSLPSTQEYTVPIGPEMPPEIAQELPKANGNSEKNAKEDEDESSLLEKLKDKAKLLEKLGGELPSGLEKIIGNETGSGTASPKTIDDIKPADIDDLLEEIEKTELPKAKTKKIDIFDEDTKNSIDSYKNSPRSGISTPQPLFPSSKFIEEKPKEKLEIDKDKTEIDKEKPEEKKGNLYLSDLTESLPANRKKLRISNSILPVKKSDVPSYTTKYSQHIEGFSSERTGLGFSQNDEAEKTENPKTTISYGNGLTFTKGEVLNEEKAEDDLQDLMDLVEAKLKHLNELQPANVTPVQEMLIQMQTLQAAWSAGGLTRSYLSLWTRGCSAALAAHEAAAPPAGWRCRFIRSEKRYKYVRESDGFEQYEYPAVAHTDMDICTTPPHPSIEEQVPVVVPAPPPPPSLSVTPPPPAWHDPPPPGCDDPLPIVTHTEPKKEIGDELLSFYEDIAELEKHKPTSNPNTASRSVSNSPEHTREVDKTKEKDKDKDKDRHIKKKSKVKISTSMGFKHKTVSSMVAKWQQVADEINSD